MKPYTKIYMDFFGYTIADFIPCEVCGQRGVDIHHADIKGMGGSKTKDYIENLVCLCRSCHNKAHAHEITKDELIKIHNDKIKARH